MNQIINMDSIQWISFQKDKSIDHCITDYVYGTEFPFDELKRVCKGNIITFTSSEFSPFVPTEKAYWIKTPSTKNYSKHIGRFVEEIYIYRQETTFNVLHWSQMTGVYDDRIIESEGHQWRKPLSLLERLVRIYTNENDTVLDPFCGSGTTLQACKNLNRNFIGIDIDKIWTDYCKERLEMNSA